jgi:ATP-dependent DNA helicase RecQ
LVARSFLKVDVEGHGGIQMTSDGMKFLQEKAALQLRKYVAKSKEKKEVNSKVVLGLGDDKEKDLFALLKAKRLEIAKAQNLPPYIIFHDKTLLEMVKLRPQNLLEMGKISGVGEAKIKKYGKVFLEVIGS